jgi:tetratricopeptide (TPR) repeat protein
LSIEPDELVRVFKKYLGVDDIEALQKEWYLYIEQVLTLDRDQKLDWGMAGYIMSLYGERAKARKFFKRAIDNGSKDAFVLYGYAELKFVQKMPGIALKYATLATEADPLHARAWCLRGQALVAEGSKEEGIKLIRMAKEMDPESREIWFILESLEQSEKEAKEKAGGN